MYVEWGVEPVLRFLNHLSAWQFLGELLGGAILETFRIEYEKLHRYVNRGVKRTKSLRGRT
jgi:hypothetical protein